MQKKTDKPQPKQPPKIRAKKKLPNVYGVAHHSPMDVMTLLPINTKVSNGKGCADIYFTKKFRKMDELQFVFNSSYELSKSNIWIIDEQNGKHVPLTSKYIDYLVNRKRV